MTNVSEPACRVVRDSTHSDGNLRERWEAHANEWIAWARAVGHDSYWRFHRDQFLQIVPRRDIELSILAAAKDDCPDT